MAGYAKKGDMKDILFARNLSNLLLAAVFSLGALIVFAAIWGANAQNRRAAENSSAMMAAGFAAAEARLEMIVRDHAGKAGSWNALRNGDMDWAEDHLGTTVFEDGTADLMIVVRPGGLANYGWHRDRGRAAGSGLLEAGRLEEALLQVGGSGAGVPAQGVSSYAISGGKLWLLAATSVLPEEGHPADPDHGDLPRLVAGLEVDWTMLRAIGQQFLVNDLRVEISPREGANFLPLESSLGDTVAYVVWTPPMPGHAILSRTLPPLGVALCMLAIAAMYLSRHIVRSARHLENALAAAGQANRGKSDFLANVSHELRTPLNGIIDALKQFRNTAPDLEQRRIIGTLDRAARSQMNLIEELLDYVSMEADRRTLNLVPLQPAAVALEVTEALRDAARAKGLVLDFEAAKVGDLTVLADRAALKRVLTNLVGNAVKFTPEGSVLVSISAVIFGKTAHLTLRVTDTGPGIDPAHHETIFDRFSRVDRSAGRPGGDPGLGLTITRALVDQMGGSVTLESMPGEGAVFELRVPLEITDPIAMAS